MIAREAGVRERAQGELTQEELYREVAPGLWRAIFVYVGGRRDIADDAVAEAFTRSLEAPSGIRDPKAWPTATPTGRWQGGRLTVDGCPWAP